MIKNALFAEKKLNCSVICFEVPLTRSRPPILKRNIPNWLFGCRPPTAEKSKSELLHNVRGGIKLLYFPSQTFCLENHPRARPVDTIIAHCGIPAKGAEKKRKENSEETFFTTPLRFPHPVYYFAFFSLFFPSLFLANEDTREDHNARESHTAQACTTPPPSRDGPSLDSYSKDSYSKRFLLDSTDWRV